MSKTVFVLGSGFSAPAGMPVQSDIMFDVVRSYSQPIQESARKVYTTLFNMVDPDDMSTVPLENVFTMLDRARHSGEVIIGLNHQQVRDSLVSLVQAIVHEFNKKLQNCNFDKYRPFFESLVKRRKGDGSAKAQEEDPFSIVSFNWDTIPDYLLCQEIDNKYGIDYACYNCDIEEKSSHTLFCFTRNWTARVKNMYNMNLQEIVQCGRKTDEFLVQKRRRQSLSVI